MRKGGVPRIALTTDRIGMPSWTYGSFGRAIGIDGITVGDFDGDNQSELMVTARSSTFQCWYLVDESGDGFRQSWLSGLNPITSSEKIKRIAYLDMDGDGASEFLVGHQSGIFQVFAPYCHTPKVTIDHDAAITYVQDFAYGNVDGVPGLEIVPVSNEDVIIFSAQAPFDVKQRFSGFGGWEVKVGNVTGGPEPEIVVVGEKGYVLAGDGSLLWENSISFGAQLALGDIDNDGLMEIVANRLNSVTTYDADTQAEKWSYPSGVTDALLVADTDGDNTAEVIYGEDQWGDVICLEGENGAVRWSIDNPEHGVDGLALADMNRDGDLEIIWGAERQLFFGDIDTLSIQWKNDDLNGPLTAVAVGDVDDDGQDEILMCSDQSNGGSDDGIMHIFDAQSRELEWIQTDFPGVRTRVVPTLAIGDVDGDGSTEFVVAVSHSTGSLLMTYDGATHTLERTTPILDIQMSKLVLANSDDDPQIEMVVGGDKHIAVFNGLDSSLEWESGELPVNRINDVLVANIDNDSNPEIIVSGNFDKVFIFDGVTHMLQDTLDIQGNVLTSTDVDGDGAMELLVGNHDGSVLVYNGAANLLQEVPLLPGEQIWTLRVKPMLGSAPWWLVGSNSQLKGFSARTYQELWKTNYATTNLGRHNHLELPDLDGDGGSEIVVGSYHSLMVFDIDCGIGVMLNEVPRWDNGLDVIDLIEAALCL